MNINNSVILLISFVIYTVVIYACADANGYNRCYDECEKLLQDFKKELREKLEEWNGGE